MKPIERSFMFKRLSKEEREKLEAIPEKEYAEQQIAYHKEQMEYWKKELRKLK
jgi:hypothetical protein